MFPPSYDCNAAALWWALAVHLLEVALAEKDSWGYELHVGELEMFTIRVFAEDGGGASAVVVLADYDYSSADYVPREEASIRAAIEVAVEKLPGLAQKASV